MSKWILLNMGRKPEVLTCDKNAGQTLKTIGTLFKISVWPIYELLLYR
jgi:hypothetical protein